MKKKLFGFLRSDRRGLALISVLGVVTLATILILALFSVSDSEFKASKIYAASANARHLADTAVNIVIGQIQAAATGAGTPGAANGYSQLGKTIWASQPGAVRVYDSSGAFIQGRTLYSSSTMVHGGHGIVGEEAMATKSPAANWAESLDQWVDLNRPVERAVTGGTTQVYFPIFDPVATAPVRGSPTGVGIEGFAILPKTIGNSGSVSSGSLGVNVAGPQATWRLPMPVEWLYVLKDGSVGTVNQSPGAKGQWAGAAGKGPTELNPIIGRVGFWTDDECCKININTAGEPGYWSQPTSLSDRERNWADSPPAIFEYQRYPGHPATVALSSVLAPGFNPTNYFPAPAIYPTANLNFKNAIYDFVPKLAQGGTNDGQLPFAPNDLALGGSQSITPALAALSLNIMAAKSEPLFPSVDEGVFETKKGTGTTRTLRHLTFNGADLITPDTMERARAFLTAHSRAPETNMFGLPRVAIWPVPDSSVPNGGAGSYSDYRTGFDSAVAMCSKLGNTGNSPLTATANTYYFRRLDPSNHLTDMGRNPRGSGGTSALSRNNVLMNYLDQLVHMTMPGGYSFAQKYSAGDAEQILVEIFDYIRCTNLYDGFLSTKTSGGHTDEERRDESLPTKLKTPTTVLWDSAPNRSQYFTYTAPRFSVKRTASDEGMSGITTKAASDYNSDPEWLKTGTYPGHGQVKPIEWSDQATGKTYRGFGRFPTISEVALHFICTGDGKPDAGSYAINTGSKTTYSGGKTAEKIDRTKANQRVTTQQDGPNQSKTRAYYYSNIPPRPSTEMFKNWGCNLLNVNKQTPDDPMLHPGANALNWNCTLEYDPSKDSGVELAVDEMRIQVCLLIETFVPSVGYTRYTPDFTMVLNPDQVSGIKVKNSKGQFVSLFSTTDPHLILQSTYAYGGDERGLNAGHDVSPLGGHFAPSALTNGRQLPGGFKMPKDAGYVDKSTSNIHAQMLNFPLVSNFITVKRQDNASSSKSGTLEFRVEKPLEVDIYATHDWQGSLDPANGVISQKVNIKFPDGPLSTPVPHLVVYSSERRDYIDSSGSHRVWNAIPAPHWWCFNSDGAVNRWQGVPTITPNQVVWKETLAPSTTPATELTFGRFRSTGYSGSVPSQDTFNSGLAGSSNGVNLPAAGLIYGYSSISTFNGVKSNPDKDLLNVDVYTPNATGGVAMGSYGYYGSDSVRSIIPVHGDYRILAARKVVDPGVWHKHPVWEKRPQALFAHSLSGSYSDAAVGFDLGGATDTTSDPKYRLVSNAYYEPNNGTDGDGKTGRLPVIPDTPLTAVANTLSTRYRDFDNGPGNLRDGPYINKPDDGNLSVMKFWHAHGSNDKTGVQAGLYVIRNTYFTSSFLQLPATSAYFTPNRIISSPGMFGSLPTGVWGSQARKDDRNPQVDGIPWRTLLFRADVDGHVGAPSWSNGTNGSGVAPADHYFMDLFFMPIVEPYAITDSYSTAGKINLNFQIVPFTNIRRATAVYAAMKGEIITAYSSVDTDPRKASGLPPSDTNTVIYKKIKDINPIPPDLWNETTDRVYFHRDLNVEETVRQLDERFEFKGAIGIGAVGLMLAPSQICELHLIPTIPAGTARQGKGTVPSEPPTLQNLNENSRKGAMLAFWRHNDLTGDNTRERPYANLYQKFTTRSNTFRVYFTAQTMVKARSLQPTQVDTRYDTVTSEFRGSALFERYLDFSTAASAAYLDYGASTQLTSMRSLEQFYHYRVIEMKQFSP